MAPDGTLQLRYELSPVQQDKAPKAQAGSQTLFCVDAKHAGETPVCYMSHLARELIWRCPCALKPSLAMADHQAEGRESSFRTDHRWQE